MLQLYYEANRSRQIDVLGEAMPDPAWLRLRKEAVRRLKSDGDYDAADELERFESKLLKATNGFGDNFLVLHFLLNVQEYDQRQANADHPDSLALYKRIAICLRESGATSEVRFVTADVPDNLAIGSGLFPELTGWERVDRGTGKIRKALEAASDEEDFQSVGFLSREALISLAQAVFDTNKHSIPDDPTAISATDAKRMLTAFIATELGGNANEDARRYAKAALDLANALQHRRTATFRDAALCAEATVAVVNICAIVAGRRLAPNLEFSSDGN